MASAIAPVRISGPFTSIITATCRPMRAETSRMRATRSMHPLLGGVGHVQADDIHAGEDEFLELLGAFGRRPERRHDLGMSVISSRHNGWFYCRRGLEAAAEIQREGESSNPWPEVIAVAGQR